VNDKLMDRVTLKFLNAAHVDSILINGTLMFSSFSHFRKKEGDRWISDPDEAGLAPIPSPFRKHPDFAAQSEVRIVLQPRQALGLERLNIRLPHPQKTFAEEFRAVPPSALGSPRPNGHPKE
jgi:hypothetical protein